MIHPGALGAGGPLAVPAGLFLRNRESKSHFSFWKSTGYSGSQHRFEKGAIVPSVRTDDRGNTGTSICRGKKRIQDASPTKRVFRHPVVKDDYRRIFGPNLTHLSRIPPQPSLLERVRHDSWRFKSARIGNYMKIFRYNLRRQCKIVSIGDEFISQYNSRIVIRAAREMSYQARRSSSISSRMSCPGSARCSTRPRRKGLTSRMLVRRCMHLSRYSSIAWRITSAVGRSTLRAYS